MSIFKIHSQVLADYRDFVRSFFGSWPILVKCSMVSYDVSC